MNERAPEGQLFVCGACGKRSRDRYGFESIDGGYDESCMLNSVLVYEARDLMTGGWKVVATEPEVSPLQNEEKG